MQKIAFISLLLLIIVSISSASFGGDPFRTLRRSPRKQIFHAVLTPEELHEQFWSQTPTLKTRNGRAFIYHNYTIYTDASGRQRTRYTKVELADPHDLQRRAFAIDDVFYQRGLWSDPRYHNGSPTIIRFCFFNQAAQDALSDAWLDAVCRWDRALGPTPGVRFLVERDEVGSFLCDPADVAGRVQLKVDNTKLTMYTGLGTFTGPHFTLSVNTAMLPAYDGFDIADALVIQLGKSARHVLGLEREHQRFDALSFLNIDCSQIHGYEALISSLNSESDQHRWPHNPIIGARQGQPITMTDYCTVGELSKINVAARLWEGGSYVPLTSSDPEVILPGTTLAVNALGDNQMRTQYGAFDPNSVMLYCGSMASGLQPDRHILRWRESNAPILCQLPRMPSAGDVLAVNLMYPVVPYNQDGGSLGGG